MALNAESVEEVAGKLEAHVHYRSEAGLFDDSSQTSVAELAAKIKEARELASASKFAEANQVLLATYAELHKAVNTKSWRWKAVHIHALDIYLYTVAVGIGLVYLGLCEQSLTSSTIWEVPLASLAFGALGGVLRSLWWITRKIETRSHRTQFRLQYFASPFIAALLGLGAYLVADFITTGLTSTPVPPPSDATVEATLGIQSLSFIAGFYWEWIVEKIKAAVGH